MKGMKREKIVSKPRIPHAGSCLYLAIKCIEAPSLCILLAIRFLPARTKKKRTVLRNGFVRPGGVDQSGHQGSPGDSRARDHEQRAFIGDAQWLQHVDVEHSRGTPRGSRNLHVSSQHGSDEESGTKKKKNYVRTIVESSVIALVFARRTTG